MPAAVPVLREQNNALHVTTERLLTTNSELTAKVNEQALLISMLKQQLAAATANLPSTRSASKSAGSAPSLAPESLCFMLEALLPDHRMVTGSLVGVVYQRRMCLTCIQWLRGGPSVI
jgi:hypothetical protein